MNRTGQYGPDRLPISAVLLAVTSCLAMNSAAAGLPGLWIVAGLVMLSAVTPARIRSDFAVWLAGLALAALMIVLTPDPPDSAALQIGPARARNILGQTLAAGMAATAWYAPRSGRTSQIVAFTTFAGLVFLTACNSYDSVQVRILVLPFTAALLATTRSARVRRPPDRTTVAAVAIASVATLLVGTVMAVVVEKNKSVIAGWANPLQPMGSWDSAPGFGGQPILGPRFGDPGDNRRVLRLAGGEGGLLRGVVFDTYENGRWGPPTEQRMLKSFDVAPLALRGIHAKDDVPVDVDRLNAEIPLLYAPLSATAFDFGDDPGVEWLPGPGPILASRRTPLRYRFYDSGNETRGLVATPPDSEAIDRMRTVPRALKRFLRKTAAPVLRGAKSDKDRIARVVGWLGSNHGYSWSFLPGAGDPIEWFLSTPGASAHCEIFASSAALLLRTAGIPTRYVVGYVAHEQDRSGYWNVRGRDAHAWVEAWCDNREWVTVEATPAAGLPGRSAQAVAWWQRYIEEVSDTAVRWRDTVQENPSTVLWVVVPVAFGILVFVLARSRRRALPEAYPGRRLDHRTRQWIERELLRRRCPAVPSEPWITTAHRIADDDPVKKPLMNYLELLEREQFGGGADPARLQAAEALVRRTARESPPAREDR